MCGPRVLESHARLSGNFFRPCKCFPFVDRLEIPAVGKCNCQTYGPVPGNFFSLVNTGRKYDGSLVLTVPRQTSGFQCVFVWHHAGFGTNVRLLKRLGPTTKLYFCELNCRKEWRQIESSRRPGSSRPSNEDFHQDALQSLRHCSDRHFLEE